MDRVKAQVARLPRGDKGQPSFRGLVDRLEPGRGDRQNAALSFHQDIARIGGGGRDEGNSASLTGSCLLAHPFRQCPGLAKTPARE
jgi:hypothetical protein